MFIGLQKLSSTSTIQVSSAAWTPQRIIGKVMQENGDEVFLPVQFYSRSFIPLDPNFEQVFIKAARQLIQSKFKWN